MKNRASHWSFDYIGCEGCPKSHLYLLYAWERNMLGSGHNNKYLIFWENIPHIGHV